MRIGAVNYLNSKPLVHGLAESAPAASVRYDLPSRLADSLAAGRLDVALIPSVELFRGANYSIVSDACVACRGPVLSVKLHFRVPPPQVRSVALDEGSRTSAALVQILLAELHGVTPRWEPLPIGCGADSSTADAVLLIGDRAISSAELGTESAEIWDLGEKWCEWTGLPFVFAMWTARTGVETESIGQLLSAARDNGVRQITQIAAREAPPLGISVELAIQYFRDYLHFTLGTRERAGLTRFYELCIQHGVIPPGATLRFERVYSDGCIPQ